MKILILIAFIPFTIISCINDDSLKPVIPHNIINANSAKTWVKTKDLKNGVDSTPSLNELKTTFTLYNNGTFREQKFVHIGSEQGRKGHYSFGISESQDTSFNFIYANNESLSFSVAYIDPEILKLNNDSLTWVFETLEAPKLK